jgi:hypothetical protein
MGRIGWADGWARRRTRDNVTLRSKILDPIMADLFKVLCFLR